MAPHNCYQCGETCDCGGYDGCDLCSECANVFDSDRDYGDEDDWSDLSDYDFNDEIA